MEWNSFLFIAGMAVMRVYCWRCEFLERQRRFEIELEERIRDGTTLSQR